MDISLCQCMYVIIDLKEKDDQFFIYPLTANSSMLNLTWTNLWINHSVLSKSDIYLWTHLWRTFMWLVHLCPCSHTASHLYQEKKKQLYLMAVNIVQPDMESLSITRLPLQMSVVIALRRAQKPQPLRSFSWEWEEDTANDRGKET